jgi:hypothetical protein
MNKKSVSVKSLLATLMFSASCLAQAAVVADFAADFSTASSTSGAWQYGSSASLGGPFNLDSTKTAYGAASDVIAWSPAGTFWPTVALNTGSSQVNFGASDAIHLAAQQGLLHPGSGGEFAVVRLNVTSSFTGWLQTEFAGIDTVGTTTDVHVLLNGVSLFASAIGAFGQTQSFSETLGLHAGDVIDFAVGRGTNGNFNDDSTGFRATLSTVTQAVPEPPVTAFLLMGLLGLAVARRSQGS